MSSHNRPGSARKQYGFTVIESLIVLSVMLSLMGLGARYLGQNAQRAVDQVAAHQLKQVIKAAHQYLQDHYDDFSKNSKFSGDSVQQWLQRSSQSVSSSTHLIAFKSLQDAGYLPAQMLPQNCYGQSYKIEVIPSGQGKQQQLLVTTQGGQKISEHSLRMITSQVGGSGGYASVLNPGKITGNQDSWALEMSSSGLLEQGHLASLMIVNQNEVMDAASFLRRTRFNGHPEYNTIKTDTEIKDHRLKLTDDASQAILSARTLTLENPVERSDSKTVTLDVAGTPMLTFRDTYNEALGNIDMLLSSDRLEFSRKSDGNKIDLDNRDPSIYLKSSNHSSTIITPERVTIENPDHSNAVSIRSDSLKTSIYSDNHIGIFEVSNHRGLFTEITNHFVKIPFIEIYEIGRNWGYGTWICGPKEREGAIFMIGARGRGNRQINICADGAPKQIAWFD